MAVSWCVYHNQRFLVRIFLIILSLQRCKSAEEIEATCGDKFDLLTNIRNMYSGVLSVKMPEDFTQFQGTGPYKKDCDINIFFGGGVNLQLELYYLDIVPKNGLQQCSTGLEVLDSSKRQVYGGRLCMEGWKWEKRHNENKQEKKVVENSPVTFRLVSDSPYEGSGFKVHFNIFRPFWPCSDHREFKCETLQRCVHDDITCDGWDDCGDDSDETDDAGCEPLSVSEIFAVIIGIFLVLGSAIATLIFLIKYRRVLERNRLMRIESKLVLEDERRSMQEPVLSFPHRFNSMESMNRSQYSKTGGPKVHLDTFMDKGDRYSYKDNMSERSYKSNSHRHRSENGSDRYGPTNRKNRTSSQSSLNKEKAGVVGSGTQGSRPDLDIDVSDKNGDARDRERNDRDDDRESLRRRRSKERRRYSDEDDDYDSDRERRRRRRSRERRRYDRSDDEDYDSDRDRRRRDRQKYDRSTDEDDDSDKERQRRKRSRDRRRYDRSSDEDYDSESDRRRRRSRDRQKQDKNDGDENDSDRESRRRSRDRRRHHRSSDDEYDSDRDRRRRSRDRRRYDSDEYDSDRDRRKRRSRDRLSRDMSEGKDEQDQSRPRQGSKEKLEKPQEPKDKPAIEQPQKDLGKEKNQQRNEPNQPSPYQEKEKPRKVVEAPVQKQQGPELKQDSNKYPPPSTPPKSEHLPKYNKAPESNSNPAKETKETNGSAWVPRSERRRNRRSRGAPSTDDAPIPVYEDVVPKIELENLGFREESV